MDDIKTFCNDILKLDPKIRFAGIYFQGDLTSKMRDGLKPLLTKEESMTSLRGAVIRWSTRELLANKLGEAKFALAQYDKVFRVTLPLGNKDLILVSIDIECDILGIIGKIIELKKKFN